jgi:hypothetical protein
MKFFNVIARTTQEDAAISTGEYNTGYGLLIDSEGIWGSELQTG